MNALQRYSHAALRDGLDLPTIRDLASLATWGQHQGNVERDFHRMIPSLFGTQLTTHNIWIDAYDPDEAKICPMELPVLLASDVLHQLWNKQSPRLWRILIGCNAQETHAFWTSFRGNRAFSEHPVFQPFGKHCGDLISVGYFTVRVSPQLFLFRVMVNHRNACQLLSRLGLEGKTIPAARSGMELFKPHLGYGGGKHNCWLGVHCGQQ